MSPFAVSLGQVAEERGIVGGPFGSDLTSSDYATTGVPVIRGANLGTRKLSGEFAFVSTEKFEGGLRKNSAEPGDLVFTQRGTLGQISIIPEGKYPFYVVSQSQMRLRIDKTRFDSDYVYYACSSSEFRRQVLDNAISTGVPHINLGILKRLTIPNRELGTQKAIGAVLRALDDRIEANTGTSKLLQNAAISALPDNLPRVPLNELARHIRNNVNPDTFPKTRVKLYSLPAYDDGQLPAIELPELIQSAKTLLSTPAVLLSKLNPRIRRIWEVPSIHGTCLASGEFLALEPVVSSTAALWAALSQPEVSSELEAQVSGTSGSHQRVHPRDALSIKIKDFRVMTVASSSIINGTMALSHSLISERTRCVALRDTLLPALISGKLRVKDAELAVEDVL